MLSMFVFCFVLFRTVSNVKADLTHSHLNKNKLSLISFPLLHTGS